MGVTVYLSEAPEGSLVRVVRIEGGFGAVRKLYELGIREGSTIKVVRNPPIGPLIVEVDGSTIALGRGIASKVAVEVVER
ncbi:TPA: ferrous iron transport protein A [Desulfurococcaceae archaeon]|nr:ferrous iron transport protein A [Desulfurococcaceae archaeon]